MASGDLSGEDAPESEEAAFVRRGNHLGDVHHEGSLWVTVHHGLGVLVIQGALVQSCVPVLLGGRRGRQVVDHHLQERLMRGQPGLHISREGHGKAAGNYQEPRKTMTGA